MGCASASAKGSRRTGRTSAGIDKIRDNIREEREDVEIMLRQLDVIFGRSKEWQHKKYEHLQAIVEDTEDD